jgi:hypothetical protein
MCRGVALIDLDTRRPLVMRMNSELAICPGRIQVRKERSLETEGIYWSSSNSCGWYELQG